MKNTRKENCAYVYVHSSSASDKCFQNDEKIQHSAILVRDACKIGEVKTYLSSEYECATNVQLLRIRALKNGV